MSPVRLGVISKLNIDKGEIAPLYDFENDVPFESNYDFEIKQVVPKSTELLGEKVVFLTNDIEEVVVVYLTDYFLSNKQDPLIKKYLSYIYKTIHNSKCQLWSLVKENNNLCFKKGQQSTAIQTIHLHAFIEGEEWYLRNINNFHIEDPNSWLEYMKKNDPQGNIFELFIKRFQSALIENDCENELYYKLLYTHNAKWRERKEKTYNYYPESLATVFDTFSRFRSLGFLSFFGSKHHDYAIHSSLDKNVFKHFISLTDGELTRDVIQKIYNLPESIKGRANPHFITWNDAVADSWNLVARQTVTKRELIEIIKEYENRINELNKDNAAEYIKNRLRIKDEYMPEIRKSVTRLCADYPSKAEIDAFKEKTKNFEWERMRT